MDRPRNEQGRFIESSPFGKKVISIRLLKPDEDKFLSVSQSLGVSPTELARQVINEWLEEAVNAKSA